MGPTQLPSAKTASADIQLMAFSVLSLNAMVITTSLWDCRIWHEIYEF